MRRARKCRNVLYPPQRLSFKPSGVPAHLLPLMELAVDEFEAIRLADYENLEHEDAAELMNISRSTFTRLIKKARSKVARFLVECCQLEIKGGNFHFSKDTGLCEDCGSYFRYNIQEPADKCPFCGSTQILSIAEELGHGDCCRQEK